MTGPCPYICRGKKKNDLCGKKKSPNSNHVFSVSHLAKNFFLEKNFPGLPITHRRFLAISEIIRWDMAVLSFFRVWPLIVAKLDRIKLNGQKEQKFSRLLAVLFWNPFAGVQILTEIRPFEDASSFFLKYLAVFRENAVFRWFSPFFSVCGQTRPLLYWAYESNPILNQI